MKLGIIGANGHRYLMGLAHHAGTHGITELAYAGDGLDDAKARAAYEKLQFTIPCRWYDRHHDMLDAFGPDVVNVGVRYGRNGDYIIDALERDMAVCSDKPIAATWAQYDRLAALVADRPARMLVSEFPLRCHPAFIAAQQAVRDGRIGQVVLATGQKSYRFGTRPDWYADRADYGGTLLWVASHAIDYLRFVTGLRYTSAAGLAGNVSKTAHGSMEEYTLSTFALENGAAAAVHADFNRPAKAPTHGDDRLRIVGSLGQVEIIHDRCTLITHDAGPADITLDHPWEPGQAMWAAITRGDDRFYGSRASLEMAATLLTARDAIDRGEILPMPGAAVG